MIVIAALVFSCFGKIETHIEATGEIRPIEAVSSIKSISTGRITSIVAVDGQNIKKGDTILEFDVSAYVEQKNTINAQISLKHIELEKYRELLNCIKNDNNTFSEESHPLFFYQYKNYEKELESACLQIEKCKWLGKGQIHQP